MPVNSSGSAMRRCGTAPPHPVIPVAPDTFETKMIKMAALSPDGRQVAYESLGHVWVRDTAGGAPRRLVSGEGLQAWPAWSRDGKRIAFVFGVSTALVTPGRVSLTQSYFRSQKLHWTLHLGATGRCILPVR